MTSLDRHEARYQRRRAKRLEKRRNRTIIYDDFENVSGIDKLMKSARQCANGVWWKPSVQRFMMKDLFNCTAIREALETGKDVRRGFVRFTIVERGHKRYIQAIHIAERVPQKSLVKNVLQPVIGSRLIYDNGACMPTKGVCFALDRLEKHLRNHYRKYGDNEGWVVLYDFHDYFGSTPHDGVKQIYRKDITDERILKLADDFVDAFDGDVGLGLGSEICQVLEVAYPSPIDHMIKDQEGVKGYARYMDDGYAITRTKEEAIRLKNLIIEKAKELKLIISEKKTQIVKLSHGFKFLKTRFILTNTGKVIKKIWRKSVTTQRRKLRKLKELYEQGIITLQDVKNPFYSWLGYAGRKTCHRTIRNMILLYVKLFPNEREVLKWKPKKQKERKSIKVQQQSSAKMLMNIA